MSTDGLPYAIVIGPHLPSLQLFFFGQLAPCLGICVNHLVSGKMRGKHVKACIGLFIEDYESFYKARYALYQLLAPIVDLFFQRSAKFALS
jgi:hypothetical protein